MAQRPLLFWVGMVLLVPIAWLIYRRQQYSLAAAPRLLRLR